MTGLVVFSGGQDSTTCLGVAKAECDRVEAISFFYGQKHFEAEAQAMRYITDEFRVPLTLISLGFLPEITVSALTDHRMSINAPHPQHPKLPASFVPNRNALFLTVAHAFAQKIQAQKIYTGVCQTDYSGYPDCREEFIRSLEATLNMASGVDIAIVTPLMHLDKAQTFRLAHDLGILSLVLSHSHTCYNGITTSNPWGNGCGECPACRIRVRGFLEYQKMQLFSSSVSNGDKPC